MSDLDHNAAYGSSVGERLRQAREARGQTLDDVASETRIPIRHLRNIEDGNWSELPAVTYTVGFARAYANAVGLDGPAIGQEVRDEAAGTGRAPTVSPEIYAPSDPARSPSRSLVWVAGILLVVLVAAWLLVIRPWLTRGDEVAAPAPAAEDTAPSAQPAQPQPAAPASVAGQQVTLVASGPVWLEIRDGAGNGGRRVTTTELAAGQEFPVPTGLQQPVIRTGRPQVLNVRIGDRDYGRLNPREVRIRDVSLRPEDLAAQLSQQPPAPTGAPAR